MAAQCFFSIGVPTYDRLELLSKTITSVLEQSFGDFELIVANDNPTRTVDAEIMGISDSRVRFVNHERNLGGVENFNYLMNAAQGRFFTWLGDDDLLMPDCLLRMHRILIEKSNLSCVFPAYIYDREYKPSPGMASEAQFMSGRCWLRKYLAKEVRVQGCYGAFEIGYLQRTGGFRKFGPAWYSPYADNFLAVKAGLLDEIAFIPDPLFFFRTHAESVSNSSVSVDDYVSAQYQFIPECMDIFRAESLVADINVNCELLLKWCVRDYCSLVRRNGVVDLRLLAHYLSFLNCCVGILRIRRSSVRWHVVSKMFGLLFAVMRDRFVQRKQHQTLVL